MTKTLSDSTTLLGELTVLLRLTRTEAHVARVRTSQARIEAVRRELADNAHDADARAARVQAAIRSLGGVPDVVADAVGRVAAITKATLEQAQPFSEGLLGDLALEHQLRDRAVFTRVLAEAQNEPTVVALMHQIEAAHAETIAWITIRLAEVAQGGPAALSPTPAQVAVSTVTRIALLPSRRSVALVNKAVSRIRHGRGQAERVAEATKDKLQETAGAARENLGTVGVEDLPIKSYENLSGGSAVKAINGLDDAEDVLVVQRFERAHKDRKGVFTATEKRMTALAKRSVDV